MSNDEYTNEDRLRDRPLPAWFCYLYIVAILSIAWMGT